MTPDAELDALRARAHYGEPRALVQLARKLLAGEGAPPSLADGVRMLRQAVEKGEAEAARLLSVCAAWGVAQTPDLNAALDQLALAARLGSASAGAELQLLAGRQSGDFAALRRAVDLARWTRCPAVRLIAARPRILIVEGFASAAECAWLIERGRPTLHRAQVYRGAATPQTAESRTNRETGFTLFNADVVTNLIRERMAVAVGASTAFFEVTKLLHYQPGQQFALHGDFLQLNTPELISEVEARGQRVATLLVYLNDDYDGGETDFPRINFRFKGRRGDALIFSNVDQTGAPDYSAVHAGLPTTRGEKWLLSQWIRSRPMGL